jgi:hypothetical protein
LTRNAPTIALALLALLFLGATCDPSGPSVSVTLHAVEDDLNDLLVVPQDSDLFLNASLVAGASPVDPASVNVMIVPWSGAPAVTGVVLSSSATAALALVPAGSLAEGTHAGLIWVKDTAGRVGLGRLDFAVRARPGPPPIGTGQKIWYDFTSDRDGVPGPDFPVDLQAFGLGSAAAPALSAQVEAGVRDALLARVEDVYYGEDPNGTGADDPVEVGFHEADPGGPDVTRICVGGEDPSGGNTIGSILIDPNNSNRASVECASIPPTGIFPREILAYQGQYAFQTAFDPLMPSRGGVPVGAHPLDPIVLAPGFDPGGATAEELARWSAITNAVQVFADALGSIVAHETGHALGLVAPGPPGVGLHGGQSGPAYAHDVTSDGVTSPAPNYLMKHGGTFNFARLAGLQGNPLPFLRALDFAYLRDRVMTDASVTQLLPPPTLSGVTPNHLTTSAVVTVTGTNLAATPSLRLRSATYTYHLIGEQWLSSTEMTGFVSYLQVPPGLYDLVLENPDGQEAALLAAVTIGP